jgi:hypothetical protein
MSDQSNLREAIQQEFLRCAVDPVHFFKKYAKIQHPIKGKVLFNLYPFQEDALRNFKDNRFNIVLKSRQMGISTLVAGHALHSMIFNHDYKILVIATKQDVAKNLVQKVQLMWEFLPAFLKQGLNIVNNNKLSISFTNGSEIKAVASSPDAARSEALSLLILDEAAFIPDIEEIWASSQMTLATGGSCIMLSTPNGASGLFHKTWQEASEGTVTEGLEKFVPILLPWSLHPDRDQTWRDQQDILLGKRLASQECDADFLSSGHTVIESEILDWYESNQVCDPVEKRGIGGDLWVWKYADYTRSYIVCADPARGDGEDYSAFHIIDVETVEQVAEFKGKIDTQMFGNLLVSIATEYNNALLIIDNRNIGWSTIQVVIDSGYKNLYYSFKNDPYLDENIHLRKAYDLKQKEDMVPGYSITVKSRPILISKLSMYFSEKSPIIKSRRFMNELRVFIWNDGKAQARKGYNDDLVMSFSMGLMVRDTSLKLRMLGIGIAKQALKNTHRSVFKQTSTDGKNWTMDIGSNKENLKWLL